MELIRRGDEFVDCRAAANRGDQTPARAGDPSPSGQLHFTAGDFADRTMPATHRSGGIYPPHRRFADSPGPQCGWIFDGVLSDRTAGKIPCAIAANRARPVRP
jgi:hypothetical protein